MNKYLKRFFPFALLLLFAFKPKQPAYKKGAAKIPVIFDTDANNELDDLTVTISNGTCVFNT